MQDNNFTLYHDNAFKKIFEFQKNNIYVNHIITDPPYNISQINNFSTMKSANRKGVDFGLWDKDFNLTDWISEYVKILNKNGSMIIFCSYRNISKIIESLEQNNMITKDILEWKKTNPMPRNVNRRYVQDTEFAIWSVKKGANWVFNKPNDVPYIRSQFIAPVVSGKERTKHPTQKSLKIMEQIIQIHTNENDLVLDPFMGSGTTGIAALRNKRKFIGIELDIEFFDITLKRFTSTLF